MSVLGRVAIMAEMHGRDLLRRRVALALLVALPLSFYLASLGSGDRSITAGGVGMAFAVSGATLFSVMSSTEVDQRLVQGGYRPADLLLGRVAFLGPLGLAIGAGFGLLMTVVSDPPRPAMVYLGLALVAMQSIPVGLAVGVAVRRELEGTLLLIGIVGLQMAVDSDTAVARALPFWGPQRVIEAGLDASGGIGTYLLVTALYAAGLFLVARILVARHVGIVRHPTIA
ncbi:MAG: hypothetical protein R2716_10335 [Microthrixaceae bacterium]